MRFYSIIHDLCLLDDLAEKTENSLEFLIIFPVIYHPSGMNQEREEESSRPTLMVYQLHFFLTLLKS